MNMREQSTITVKLPIYVKEKVQEKASERGVSTHFLIKEILESVFLKGAYIVKIEDEKLRKWLLKESTFSFRSPDLQISNIVNDVFLANEND